MQHKKVPPIPLGDNLSETAGQTTLRDAPVVLKLRRKVAAFFGDFFLLEKKVTGCRDTPDGFDLKIKTDKVKIQNRKILSDKPQRSKLWYVGPPPTTLNLKLQKIPKP